MTTLRRAVASAARQSFARLKVNSVARTSIVAASALGRRRESNLMQEPPRLRRVPQQVRRQVVVEPDAGRECRRAAAPWEASIVYAAILPFLARMDATMMFKIGRRAAILAACLMISLATIAETPMPKTSTRRLGSALDPMTSTVIHQIGDPRGRR